jgi:ribosomal protein L7/L12
MTELRLEIVRLANLTKNYITEKLKEVCKLDANSLVQSLSSSLNVETSRYLAAFARNSRPEGRRWRHEKKVFAVSILKHSP